MDDDDFEEGFFDEDDGKESKKKTKKKSKKKIKRILSKTAIKKLKKNKTKIIWAVLAIIIAIIALIYFGTPKLGKLTEDKLIAKVNGAGISSQDLDNAYEMFFLVMGYPEQYKQMITKQGFLDQLINEELLLQKAKELGIEVSDDDVNKIFNNVVNKSGLSIEEINEQLALKGFDENDLKDYYKRQLTLTKLVNETVFNKISIDDEEIKEFYDSNINMFKAQEGQIRVSHILVETREEAREILKELQEGADFKELAKEKSIEPAARITGGDLGFFSKGQMVKEFEEAAFSLKIAGQLSGPVETQFGWHIIKKESDILSFKDAKDKIIGILKSQKEQKMLKAYVDELKKSADIEILEEKTEKEGIFTELEEENKTEEEIIEEIEKTSCVEKYGISDDTIVFYYASWSPRSKAMIPIVNELSEEDYDFYMAEIDTDNVNVINDCFSDVISEHIPEFICAGSGSMTAGEMSKESLKKFADLCS